MDLILLTVLLIITYFTGRWIEYGHFLSLEAREAKLGHVAVLPMDDDPYLSHAAKTQLVSASCSLSADYFRMFLSWLVSLFGGSLTQLQSVSDRARREVILR